MSDIWDNFETSPVEFMPNITYKSYYYLFVLQPKKFSHVKPLFIFMESLQFVGKKIGFKVLVFGPAGPNTELGHCTFLSTLVF